MKKIQFSVDINAPKEKVWNVLWDDSTYRQWTSVFSEGSYAVTDWKEGSKVLFLSPEGDGMVSRIARKVPNEYMSFEHLGEAKNGQEQPMNEETKKWAGATENYSLKESGAITTLSVDMDITEDHHDYFNETFPKALDKIKALAENGG